MTPFEQLERLAYLRQREGCSDRQDGPAGEFCYCASVFDGDLSRPLIAALPPLVRLRSAAGSPLRASIDLLVAKLDTDGPGRQALLDRLLDVALVQALRTWFTRADATTVPGWLRALNELGLAVALLPDIGDELAASTSSVDYGLQFSFAAAFKRRVGAALGQWRRDHRPSGQPGPGPGAGFGAGVSILP